jgi:hypothetical protein
MCSCACAVHNAAGSRMDTAPGITASQKIRKTDMQTTSSKDDKQTLAQALEI